MGEKPDSEKEFATNEALKFLEETLNYLVKDFKGKRDVSRLATNLMQRISIVCGGVVTVLVGIQSSQLFATAAPTISVVTLILSATLTALNAWAAFSGHRGKWVRYRTSLSMIYTIRDEIEYRKKIGPIDSEQVENWFKQIMLTIHETNQEWMNLRGTVVSSTSAPPKK